MDEAKYETMCRNAYEFGSKEYSARGQEANFLRAVGAVG